MKKIIFCLALILCCSLGVTAQSKSSISKVTKKPTAKESWTAFYSDVKIAVINRNRTFIESVLTTEIYCQSWDVCKFSNGEVKGTSDMIFKKWNENRNRGWLNLKQTLEKGELTDRGNDVDEDGNELAWKYQILPKTECEGFWIQFEFEKSKWTIESFSYTQISCP